MRVIARSLGVKSPTQLQKSILIDEILKVYSGEQKPYYTKMGRTPFRTNINYDNYSPMITPDKIKKINLLLSLVKQEIFEILIDNTDR